MILSLANELPAFSKSEKVFEPWENVNPGTNSFGVNDKETSVLNSEFNNQQNKQNEGMCVIKRNGRQKISVSQFACPPIEHKKRKSAVISGDSKFG